MTAFGLGYISVTEERKSASTAMQYNAKQMANRRVWFVAEEL